MRQYYVHLRLYRMQDQSYWTFCSRVEAASLGALEELLHAFEAGLRVSNADRLSIENLGIDMPLSKTVDYVDFTNPKLQEDLKYFLGTKRDRRHKEPPKVESDNVQ